MTAAGTLTTYGREWLLSCAFRKTDGVAGPLWLALTRTTADLVDDGAALDEPLQIVSYERESVDLGAAAWTFDASRYVAYNVATMFNPPVGDWGLINSWALCTTGALSKTAGPVIGVGALINPRRFQPGVQARVPAGTIRFGLRD